MPVSEAKKKANKKWNEAHPYDRVSLLLIPPNNKESVMKHAASQGKTLNAYINNLIREDMDK
ncbi:hypothetical protein SAMN02745823_03522 [Sporobacter termitidis DSM 10068]|uniref:HicB family protein n=1 Tax=Sporobacter termitidis DSM 10068 TaxID=1123282 RepID=A0A1M5ZD75_9FIRM|nr:hypothetical protein [Sporobacter termitidis]SHI21943.1 hypothetical protein SAMN02745823_03522 [Sporobacter termitidis DSM 10068]